MISYDDWKLESPYKDEESCEACDNCDQYVPKRILEKVKSMNICPDCFDDITEAYEDFDSYYETIWQYKHSKGDPNNGKFIAKEKTRKWLANEMKLDEKKFNINNLTENQLESAISILSELVENSAVLTTLYNKKRLLVSNSKALTIQNL